MVHIDKYCLTYKNPTKRMHMIHKFEKLGWHVRMMEGVDVQDSVRVPAQDQISQAIPLAKWDPHAWSVMQGHLCMLETYVQEGTAPYAICMEDDILIRSDINDHLPKIMHDFELCKLDLLMLGYLTPDPLHEMEEKFPIINQVFSLHTYPFNVYGTQMYVVKRSHAEWLVHNLGYASGWHEQVLLSDHTYNADWVITKMGTTACVYPLLAIESQGGGAVYADSDQSYFHTLCHDVNYLPHIHI
jgi:hypothetical protein